jgi:hypothetical protein
MARYLIVAHQTAESEELQARIRALAEGEPEAKFTLPVPATPVASLLLWEEDETAQVAQRRADQARQRLLADGVRVVEARIGDADPYAAVTDELVRWADYAGILVGTLPPGASRWLKMDLISRLHRLESGCEILHVVARSPDKRKATP